MLKKLFKFLIGLILVFGAVYILLALLAKPAPNHPFFDPDDEMLVIAHQGGNNLRPDNTLSAYKNAWNLGVDVLEMDVHSTRDDVLVLIHDDTVDRTTDGSGRVLDYTFQELQALDAGYNWTEDDGATYPYRGQGITIPALEEVFTTFPDSRMNIEIKQSEPSITASLCNLIRSHGMSERVLIASFDQETIQTFREDCPEVATTAGQSEVILLYGLSLVYLERLYSPAAEAVQVPEYREGIHVLIPRFVKAAQERNMDVHVWTVNEVNQMQRMLDLGLDGIITDNPDQLLDLLGR
jgi:glycerophosphoryl diester phosphodiesterase